MSEFQNTLASKILELLPSSFSSQSQQPTIVKTQTLNINPKLGSMIVWEPQITQSGTPPLSLTMEKFSDGGWGKTQTIIISIDANQYKQIQSETNLDERVMIRWTNKGRPEHELSAFSDGMRINNSVYTADSYDGDYLVGVLQITYYGKRFSRSLITNAIQTFPGKKIHEYDENSPLYSQWGLYDDYDNVSNQYNKDLREAIASGDSESFNAKYPNPPQYNGDELPIDLICGVLISPNNASGIGAFASLNIFKNGPVDITKYYDCYGVIPPKNEYDREKAILREYASYYDGPKVHYGTMKITNDDTKLEEIDVVKMVGDTSYYEANDAAVIVKNNSFIKKLRTGACSSGNFYDKPQSEIANCPNLTDVEVGDFSIATAPKPLSSIGLWIHDLPNLTNLKVAFSMYGNKYESIKFENLPKLNQIDLHRGYGNDGSHGATNAVAFIKVPKKFTVNFIDAETALSMMGFCDFSESEVEELTWNVPVTEWELKGNKDIYNSNYLEYFNRFDRLPPNLKKWTIKNRIIMFNQKGMETLKQKGVELKFVFDNRLKPLVEKYEDQQSSEYDLIKDKIEFVNAQD